MQWEFHACPHLAEGWCRDCVRSNVSTHVDAAVHDVNRTWVGVADGFHLKVRHAIKQLANDLQAEAKSIPLGETFRDGPLAGTSVFNVYQWASDRILNAVAKSQEGK